MQQRALISAQGQLTMQKEWTPITKKSFHLSQGMHKQSQIPVQTVHWAIWDCSGQCVRAGGSHSFLLSELWPETNKIQLEIQNVAGLK
jgi:hypothetical protein